MHTGTQTMAVLHRGKVDKSSPNQINRSLFTGKIVFSQRFKVGRENPRWLGDKVGYNGIHSWLKRRLGKASKCAISSSHKSRFFNWANISGEYKRDLSDWIELCPQCHSFMDKLGYSISMLKEKEKNRKALLLTL